MTSIPDRCEGAASAGPAKPVKEDESVKKDVARNYVIEGDEALEKGDLERALERFERAERLVPAPTVLLRIGRVEARLGRLVAAQAKFAEAAKMDLPSEAPAPFFKAVVEAQRELASLEPKIPTLEIVAPAGVKDGKLDDQPLLEDAFAKPIPIDPGPHRVSLSCCGEQRAVAKEGEHVKLVFKMPEKPREGQGPSAMFIGGLVALGVGATSLGVGVYGTVAALGYVKDIEPYASRYTSDKNICEIAAGNQADQPFDPTRRLTENERAAVTDICNGASTSRLMQFVGYPVAILGIGAGTVMLLLTPRSAKPNSSRFDIQPVFGATQNGLIVRGIF